MLALGDTEDSEQRARAATAIFEKLGSRGAADTDATEATDAQTQVTTLEATAASELAEALAATGARVVLHTHQTWALALNMLENNRLVPASQSAAFFHGRIAYDDAYAGTADTTEEGERLAQLVGDKTVVFMKSHGVLVVGETVAQAYRRIYMLERVCRAQLIAMASGEALEVLSEDIVAQVQAPTEHDRHRGQRERLFFEAMMRVLDRENPGYDA